MKSFLILLITIILLSCSSDNRIKKRKMTSNKINKQWEEYLKGANEVITQTDDIKILLKLKHNIRDLYLEGIEGNEEISEETALKISRLTEKIDKKINKKQKNKITKNINSVDIVANKIEENKFIGATDDGSITVFTENDLKSSYLWPLKEIKITSLYGFRKDPFEPNKIKFHHGIDLAGKTGENIYCSNYGRVIFAGKGGGYGLMIIISHKNGIMTVYGHLSKISVKKGQYVGRNEIIGEVGSTGRSTGPHLHFEIRKNNKSINPIVFMNLRGHSK